MYKFVDTIEQPEGVILPAEALSINGEYIENIIDGYRTLSTSGREMLGAEITEQEKGAINGTKYKYKRYPARDIEVTYQITASTAEELMDKCNVLNELLNVEEARLIFADEPDKYFTGTPSNVTLPSPGRTNITASFNLHCADPFKRSLIIKEFPASEDADGILSVAIQNEGSVAVPISYELTMNHENGFVGIVSDAGAMQFGNIEEVDGAVADRSEILVNAQDYNALNAFTTGGGVFESGNTWPSNGTWKSTTINGKKYLTVNSVGSGSGWHGASKFIEIPADSDGNVGTSKFYVEAQYYFATIKHKSQTGLMELVIGDADGKNLASIHIVKSSTVNNMCSVVFQIASKEVGRVRFEPTYYGEGGDKGKPMYIRKSGELFEFCWNNKKYQYRRLEYADKIAKTITLFVGQYGKRGTGATALVGRMGIKYLRFRKDDVEYWNDIPNRYAEGDVLTINGDDTKFYVNGIASLGDEVLGTTYFKARPGETRAEFLCSDFSVPKPTVKAFIKEAWI